MKEVLIAKRDQHLCQELVSFKHLLVVVPRAWFFRDYVRYTLCQDLACFENLFTLSGA
jgi:hypothetical protein